MPTVSFAPVNFQGLHQASQGCKRPVKFCPANYIGKRQVVLPEGVGLKVRYTHKGGLMYATNVVRPCLKAKTAPARKAPARAFRPAAPRALGGMLIT